MKGKFKQVYRSNDGYWRGKSAIQKLSKASGSTKLEAEKCLMRQPLYQIYLPPPKYIPIMRVCHYKLNQMIFIRHIFFIYLMTNTERKYITMP